MPTVAPLPVRLVHEHYVAPDTINGFLSAAHDDAVTQLFVTGYGPNYFPYFSRWATRNGTVVGGAHLDVVNALSFDVAVPADAAPATVAFELYVVVHPAWRGRGVGRALVADICDQAAVLASDFVSCDGSDPTTSHVIAQVAPKNEVSIRLFSSAGFDYLGDSPTGLQQWVRRGPVSTVGAQ